MLAACSRPAPNHVNRLAILPIENLTGETELDWVTKSGALVLTGQITGAASFLPFAVNSSGDAYAINASQLLHTTLTKRGKAFHLESMLEDLSTHKTLRAPSGESMEALAALDQLAHRIDTGARPYATNNEEAVAAWSRDDAQRAVELDPDFGPAWEYLIDRLMASQKLADAERVASAALARPNLKGPLDRARLELFTARDVAARTKVLRKITDMVPNDPTGWIAAAEGESLARNFPEAMNCYRRAMAIIPGNPGVLNGMGYAEGEAGNLAAAKTLLEQYGKDPEQATNALDSLGEVHLMNGQFKEAEKYFQQTFERDPNFLNGAPLMKAAFARWLSRDMAGADVKFQEYLGARANSKDQSLDLREAQWLFATERPEAAFKKLERLPAAQRSTIETAWRNDDPQDDLAVLRTKYEVTPVAFDGLPRTTYAAALMKTGKAGEARELLKRWPLPGSINDPMIQSLVYPRYLALRKSLGM